MVSEVCSPTQYGGCIRQILPQMLQRVGRASSFID